MMGGTIGVKIAASHHYASFNSFLRKLPVQRGAALVQIKEAWVRGLVSPQARARGANGSICDISEMGEDSNE